MTNKIFSNSQNNITLYTLLNYVILKLIGTHSLTEINTFFNGSKIRRHIKRQQNIIILVFSQENSLKEMCWNFILVRSHKIIKKSEKYIFHNFNICHVVLSEMFYPYFDFKSYFITYYLLVPVVFS